MAGWRLTHPTALRGLTALSLRQRGELQLLYRAKFALGVAADTGPEPNA